MNLLLGQGPKVARLAECRRIWSVAEVRKRAGPWRARLLTLSWSVAMLGWGGAALCTVLSDHEELSPHTRMVLALAGWTIMALDFLATLALAWSLEPAMSLDLRAPAEFGESELQSPASGPAAVRLPCVESRPPKS